MEKEAAVKLPETYQKLYTTERHVSEKNTKVQLLWIFAFVSLSLLVIHSMISVWHLKTEIGNLQRKIFLLEMKEEVDSEILKNFQTILYAQSEKNEDTFGMSDDSTSEEKDSSQSEDDFEEDITNPGLKRKREIRDYNDSSEEKIAKEIKNQKLSTEALLEKSSELSSEMRFFPSSSPLNILSTRKPHFHRKHRKSKTGSAERFFTETHSTTSTPIQVRQSRTQLTQSHNLDKTLWLQSQKFQQHTSPRRDTITKEEALKKGYGKHLENGNHELDSSKERGPDALSYNMITIHFSADTSHYSRERDPHYFGNGRMQIKSEVYKDWKPAHWTQGVGMSKYFHLHQGRVTVSTTGIYLIYAQIQYSNVQEVNGFGVFRNKEVVVQCITTSTHPDRHEIKSNTCGISTTILLQSNDSVCIKDLHHGRYVVLTPEKSYFGLVLLSPFKN